MRVVVQDDVCQGHTLCCMTAPEVFGLREDDGHSFVQISEFTPEQLEAAKRAALNCPEQAILVED
ncbi:MAG: ferredoxin [Acidobacteriota bacterium]|nr:ferredoxin [Acidobacteriota bacterium]